MAKAKISIFAVSTFNTDYLLIQKQALKAAKAALISQGYQLNNRNHSI